MAKGPTKSAGASRFRLVVLEAEVADGDISQLAQAISNALKGPAQPVVQRLGPASPKVHLQDADNEGEEVNIDEPDVEITPRIERKREPRKPAATPDVLDLRLDSPSLSDYVAQAKRVSSHRGRYLLIAGYFSEKCKTPSITADHIYTCYKWLKWPINIPDFAQPLRALKAEKLFTQPERGHYAINHIGLQRVADLLAGSGEE